MVDYKHDAELLLQYIGGKENINAVSHCVTRMRFVLVDSSKADIEKIERIESVKGTFTQSGQFQVIIGNGVNDFYNDFVEVSGCEGVTKQEVKSAAKSNQTWLQKFMTNIAEIFAPLIPAIIVGGLILGFRNIIDSVYVFGDGTQSLVQLSQTWAGIDHFLWLIGEAVFHTGIPVGICWSVQKKMGGTPMLGIVLGLTLVSGQLCNAYGVAGLEAAGWPDQYTWNFGFATARMIGYQAQVLPAIFAAFTLAYLEKWFRKHTPQVCSMIVVPFCSLLLAVMAAHFILGPIGWTIGEWVSTFVQAGITGKYRVLFGAVFGFFYAPLVITGLHHMSNAIDLQLIADTPTHGTMLWPMIALSNIAQGSAVLAMSHLQKNNQKAKEVNVPSYISCYLGVTEPAMFGVNLKYHFPFLCAMIGSSIAGMVSVGFACEASAIGVGGLPGILSMKPYSMKMYAICMVIAIVVPYGLTYVVGKKRVDHDGNVVTKDETLAVNSDEEMHAPMCGEVLPLSEVEDQTFSKGLIGEGYAIKIEDGVVVAPFSGTIVMAFPTGHALGLKADNGKEILIHVGMDTVELNGEGFEVLVNEGQHVKQDDVLIKVDLDVLKKANKSLVSPVVFTDQTSVVVKKAHQVVQAKESGVVDIE